MRKTRSALTLAPALSVAIALLAVAFVATSVFAYDNSVTYTGQGIGKDDSGTYKLNTQQCGVANGAPVDGAYIQWNLTATGASNANIAGPWGTASMTRSGGGNGKKDNGAFKYISDWYDLSTLPDNVTATYDGAEKNAQLTISHGCPPPDEKKGAWCSPGFWKNAEEAAWEKTGYSKSALFNDTVYDSFYGDFLDNTTLETVLTTNGGDYKGRPVPGTSGYNLNAYNATAAFLTDQIPGYQFSWEIMQAEEEDSKIDPCPLNHNGDYK